MSSTWLWIINTATILVETEKGRYCKYVYEYGSYNVVIYYNYNEVRVNSTSTTQYIIHKYIKHLYYFHGIALCT